MITSKEEQLNEFFENGMSPADEQNFLISVAASDELRRAFRSQLELMKAVRSDKDSLRSVAQVRNRTLAALGLSATAAGQFFEHELLRGEKAAARPAAETLVAQAPSTGMQWAARLSGRLLHAPALTLAGGLLLGILSTTAVEHFASVPPSGGAVPATIHSERSQASRAETIPSKNGLHTTGERSFATVAKVRIATHHAAARTHAAGMSEHQVANGSPSTALKPAANVTTPATVQASTNPIPEISKNNPGVMQSQKIKIIQKDDSTRATK